MDFPPLLPPLLNKTYAIVCWNDIHTYLSITRYRSWQCSLMHMLITPSHLIPRYVVQAMSPPGPDPISQDTHSLTNPLTHISCPADPVNSTGHSYQTRLPRCPTPPECYQEDVACDQQFWMEIQVNTLLCISVSRRLV